MWLNKSCFFCLVLWLNVDIRWWRWKKNCRDFKKRSISSFYSSRRFSMKRRRGAGRSRGVKRHISRHFIYLFICYQSALKPSFVSCLCVLVTSPPWRQPATSPVCPCTQDSTSSVFQVRPWTVANRSSGTIHVCSNAPFLSACRRLRQPGQPQSTRSSAGRTQQTALPSFCHSCKKN